MNIKILLETILNERIEINDKYSDFEINKMLINKWIIRIIIN